MAEWVIDTNVLIIATTAQLGRPPAILVRKKSDVPVKTENELYAVFSWLEAFNHDPDAHVVLDNVHHLIEDEYSHNIEKSEYGRMVIAHKITTGKCRWVEVAIDKEGFATIMHEAADRNPGIVKDPDDRRMVAAAVEAGAPIANASDTDWIDLLEDGSLAALGVTVHHLIESWCRDTWKRKHGIK